MNARDEDSSVPALIAIGAVFAFAGVAVIAALSQTVVLALDSFDAAAATKPFVCRICGVVESVREVEHVHPRHEVSTVVGGRVEGLAMILGALSGQRAQSGTPRIFEVLVRMEDGSLRAMRDHIAPEWRTGDRVKFLRGRIERLS